MILEGLNLLETAREIAQEAHRDYFRADHITPYFYHPLDVARRFQSHTDAENFYRGSALALCHDVIEKTEISLQTLSERGLESIVVELDLLTHNKQDSYLDYLLKIRNSGNLLALHVKLADMDANLATVDQVPDAKRAKTMKEKWLMGRYILTHP